MKSDESGRNIQSTIVDTLADVKAAERELLAAEGTLKTELQDGTLSDAQRQDKETQLKQIRYEIGAASAADVVKTGYDKFVIDGKLSGLGAFMSDTVVGVAKLAGDLAAASDSVQARDNLRDRAEALLYLLGHPTSAITALQNSYDKADSLERDGQITAANELRTKTDLALASTLTGAAGTVRSVASGIGKASGLLDDLAGAGKPAAGTGGGVASAVADAEAGMSATPTTSIKSVSTPYGP